MNYFKAAEQVLFSVPTLERALENLKRREERLVQSGAPREPGAIDYSKPFTDSHFVSDTLNELLELAEVTKNINETKAELSEINSIIEQMQGEHKKLVRLWYLERKPKEAVMEAMFVESLSTIYDLRNKAVAEFALLYYGASALRSV